MKLGKRIVQESDLTTEKKKRCAENAAYVWQISTMYGVPKFVRLYQLSQFHFLTQSRVCAISLFSKIGKCYNILSHDA